jgi:hypothetical protein
MEESVDSVWQFYYIRERRKNIHKTVALRVQTLNQSVKGKAIPVTGHGGP